MANLGRSRRPAATLDRNRSGGFPTARVGPSGGPRGKRADELQSRHGFGLGRLSPELPRGQARALRKRAELGPDHVGIDRRLPDPSPKAAVAARDDVLAPDQAGVAADALRDQLRM